MSHKYPTFAFFYLHLIYVNNDIPIHIIVIDVVPIAAVVYTTIITD